MSFSDTDLTAADVSWDLSGLLSDVDASSPRELVERAQVLADDLQHYKGTIAHISSDELFDMMSVLSETSELLSRAGHFTTLKFSENTADPEIAAEMQFINEQANSVSTKLLFIDLEWAELSSERSRTFSLVIVLTSADTTLRTCVAINLTSFLNQKKRCCPRPR